MKGKFVIIIGPSAGVGKTSLVNALLERIPRSIRITTVTTRVPREGEVEGEDFFFVTRERFEMLRDKELFIEWSEHLNSYYGTPREDLEQLLSKHTIVFGVLDINGAQQVMEQESRAVTIFIKPGDMNDLERRLKERRSVGEEEREERLRRAVLEIEAAPLFHHTVINTDGKFEDMIQTTQDIIMSELASHS